MNSIFKSFLIAGLCALTLGACTSHGHVRGTTSVGAYHSPSGTSGTLYYYQDRPLYQPYYRYQVYPNYRYRSHPNPRYYHHRTWRNDPQHRHWRNHPHRPGDRPITRPNRPDRVTPVPPARRPGNRAPARVNPMERRQVE